MTIDWRITPSDRLASELKALADFVTWLREAYPEVVGQVVKPCWPRHADMRLSLAAVRAAWSEAISRGDRGDQGISILHWEDELERAATGRWMASMKGCDEACARVRRGSRAAIREREAVAEACQTITTADMRGGLPPLSTPPRPRRPQPAPPDPRQMDLTNLAGAGEPPNGHHQNGESADGAKGTEQG